MDAAVHEVLSHSNFPRAPWLPVPCANPLERLNAEIKRRTHAVGIFPNEAASTRRVGAKRLELNDEGGLNRRGMQLEGEHSHRDTAPAPVSAIQR